mmetsp:Transcript_97761/g.280884  ORF Transcript_97761/g.280884 Transcript_97761/m.280884 type:complete len:299 (-) Transcript_97761:83-979(-)
MGGHCSCAEDAATYDETAYRCASPSSACRDEYRSQCQPKDCVVASARAQPCFPDESPAPSPAASPAASSVSSASCAAFGGGERGGAVERLGDVADEGKTVALPRLLTSSRMGSGVPPVRDEKKGRSAASVKEAAQHSSDVQPSSPDGLERFKVLIKRECPEDYLGLDVKQVEGDLLQVVHVFPDGAAAAAASFTGQPLKTGDLITRVNGVSSCEGMVSECVLRANLALEVLRPCVDVSDSGSSAGKSGATTLRSARVRPRVPPLKLPLNTNFPCVPRKSRSTLPPTSEPAPRGLRGAP